MRLLKGLIMAIGVIGIMVIIALLIGFYLYSLSPPIQAKMTKPQLTEEAAQSLKQKLDDLDTQIKSALDAREKRPVQLTITEQEINSVLANSLAEGQLPLNGILVNFGDGYFLIYAVVEAPVIDAKTGTMGRIEIVDGKPKIKIDEFNLGKLPVPESFKTRIEQLSNIMANSEIADIPVEMTSAQLKDHQLILEGTTKTGE